MALGEKTSLPVVVRVSVCATARVLLLHRGRFAQAALSGACAARGGLLGVRQERPFDKNNGALWGSIIVPLFVVPLQYLRAQDIVGLEIFVERVGGFLQ